MPSLYNCKHSGDQYRISKFDSDFNLEASYLLDADNCECPAGHRPTCRHRQMLPKFIQREHIGDGWFFDHDRGGWVQGWKEEPLTAEDLTRGLEDIIPVASEALPIQHTTEPSPNETVTIATYVEIPEGASSEDIAEAFGNLLAPAGLDQASEQVSDEEIAFHDAYDLLPEQRPSSSSTIRRRV